MRKTSDGGWRPGRWRQTGRPRDGQSRCGVGRKRAPHDSQGLSDYRWRREIKRGLAGRPEAVSRLNRVFLAFVLIGHRLYGDGIERHLLDPVTGAEDKLDNPVRRPLRHDARCDKRRQKKGQKPRPEHKQAHMSSKAPPHSPTLRHGQFRNNDGFGLSRSLAWPRHCYLITRSDVRYGHSWRGSAEPLQVCFPPSYALASSPASRAFTINLRIASGRDGRSGAARRSSSICSKVSTGSRTLTGSVSFFGRPVRGIKTFT